MYEMLFSLFVFIHVVIASQVIEILLWISSRAKPKKINLRCHGHFQNSFLLFHPVFCKCFIEIFVIL